MSVAAEGEDFKQGTQEVEAQQQPQEEASVALFDGILCSGWDLPWTSGDDESCKLHQQQQLKKKEREDEKERLRQRIRSRVSEILAVYVDTTPDPAADTANCDDDDDTAVYHKPVAPTLVMAAE